MGCSISKGKFQVLASIHAFIISFILCSRSSGLIFSSARNRGCRIRGLLKRLAETKSSRCFIFWREPDVSIAFRPTSYSLGSEGRHPLFSLFPNKDDDADHRPISQSRILLVFSIPILSSIFSLSRYLMPVLYTVYG